MCRKRGGTFNTDAFGTVHFSTYPGGGNWRNDWTGKQSNEEETAQTGEI